MTAPQRISRRSFLSASTACTSLAAMQDDGAAQTHGLDELMQGSGIVRIRAGEFSMGSENSGDDEQPVHRVRIAHDFEIGKYEVTQAQWATVMTDAHPDPAHPMVNAQGTEVSRDPSHFKGASLPVESVSWDDVELFLKRLNARDSNHGYRLPTEAEWEYACKAGHKERPEALGATGWCKSDSGEQTHPVGLKKPNAWGLYDMDGNVAEWVQDWYSRNYYEGSPRVDPTGPRGGTYRVFRGGSWLDTPERCRAAYRGFDFPVSRFYNVGFRVVRFSK